MPPTVVLVVGTRPEAVKLAPVCLALRNVGSVAVELWAGGQHRELADDVLAAFGVTPERRFDLFRPGQSLSQFASRFLGAFDDALEERSPDLVLVQGDTTTALAGALGAFYRKVPLGHVEAGLRTGSVARPWPEEANRRLITPLATLHFAATLLAQANLLAERVAPGRVHLVGNPVIDALLLMRDRPPAAIPGLPGDILDAGRKLVLITSHRRENADGLAAICSAVGDLAGRHPDARFVFPLHPNPATQSAAREVLAPLNLENVFLTAPLGYQAFTALLARAAVCLTDSGGVQEEAPALGTPLVILRDETERPEVLSTGLAVLAGTDRVKIVTECERWLGTNERPAASHVFGDGRAAGRIATVCGQFLATSRSVP